MRQEEPPNGTGWLEEDEPERKREGEKGRRGFECGLASSVGWLRVLAGGVKWCWAPWWLFSMVGGWMEWHGSMGSVRTHQPRL